MPNAHDGYIALISGVTNEEAHHPNFIAWTPLVLTIVSWITPWSSCNWRISKWA